jgi:hypothetical protein
MRGAPPRGRGESASCLYEGHIYFELNMSARQNAYFGRHFACLKYFTYHLVPVLGRTVSSTFCRRLKLESKSKVKQSLYTPWRRLGGEEV